MLGHELRNPLAPILNALHVMRVPGVKPKEIGQAHQIAERQVRHLARLVDDLLDVSRIDRGKIELRRGLIDLRDSAARAAETALPLVESRRYVLSVALPDEPVPVLADGARVGQVLANLLNNAAKYTEPGGRISLSVAREGGEAVARVADDGTGIDPDLLPRVFELFTQAERSLDRSQGGLGIGLTLVRRLVELHGGRVEARSAGVGLGSEFTVRLPIAQPSPGEDAASPPCLDPAADFPSDSPQRILVVDDNVDGAEILARLMKAGGHRVEVAHDGLRALEVARSLKPEVVLLDIGPPEMDGYQVARRLRALDGLERAMLVALTGYGQGDDRLRSVAGFDSERGIPHQIDQVCR